MSHIRATLSRLVEYGCRGLPAPCECATLRPDPACDRCDGGGEHLCFCVGMPPPEDFACPACEGKGIISCANCLSLPRPDADCSMCAGTGARRSDPFSGAVAGVVAAGFMDLLLDLRRHEAHHVYDEALDVYAEYIAMVREREMAERPDAVAESLRMGAEVLCGVQDHRSYRSPSPVPPQGSLSPQEQFELLGEAPAEAVLCRGCGQYTMGIPSTEGPLDWRQGDRVCCCSKDACLAAWDDACSAAQTYEIATR